MERHKKVIGGPISAVPCPWCGNRNDMREINEQFPLETGCVVDCDNCKRKSIVASVDVTPRIFLRQKHT